MRTPTAHDVLRILREHSREVELGLAVSPVRLSFPLDGRGARIRVSVRPGDGARLPACVEVEMDGGRWRVPVEVTEDYEQPVAL